jgi:fumarate hydratase class II
MTPPSRVNPVELAAWTVVCSTVLNLDEALTKE